MASNPETGEALEAAVLEEMLAAHERQLDEVLDRVIGVIGVLVVAARAARDARLATSHREPGSELRED